MNIFRASAVLLGLSMALLVWPVVHTSDPASMQNQLENNVRLTSVMNSTVSAIRFEENIGQFADGVLFAARLKDGLIAFLPDEVVFMRMSRKSPGKSRVTKCGRLQKGHSALRGYEAEENTVAVLRVRYEGARAETHPVGMGEQSVVLRYALDSLQSAKAQRAKGFDTVMYKDLYPGIDLRFYTLSGRVKYDFVVHPGANPKDIRMHYIGSDVISMNERRGMDIRVGEIAFHEEAPIVYAAHNAKYQFTDASFAISGDTVGFDICEYSKDDELIIDPAISTYFGGADIDAGGNINVLSSGNIVISGRTDSPNIPTTAGAYIQVQPGHRDAYIAILSPDGKRLLYATYFGGSGDEYAACMSINSQQDILIAGYTTSKNLPTTSNAFQKEPVGNQDGYIAMFDSTLSTLKLCTYLGGTGYDDLLGMTVDLGDNICVTGLTDSRDFPRSFGVIQYFYGGGEDDIFITKLSPDGSSLVMGTYFGGNDFDEGYAIASDAEGNLCVGGLTDSRNFLTTPNACKPIRELERSDQGFIVHISANGRKLLYSTYLGGTNSDYVTALTLDGNLNVFACGYATSYDFPTTRGVVQETSTCWKGFVAKLSLLTGSIAWATYIGSIGGGSDIQSISVLSNGSVVICGRTESHEYPVTRNAFQDHHAGVKYRDSDGIITLLDSSASKYIYSSYYGGSDEDYFFDCCVAGNTIYFSGNTLSPDFPITSDCLQSSNAGSTDAMIVAFPLDELITSIEPARVVAETRTFDLHAFPNPVIGPVLQLRYTLPKYGMVVIRLQDLAGRVVREIVKVHYSSGEYQHFFDIAGLPSGLYVYSVESNGMSESAKIVKL